MASNKHQSLCWQCEWAAGKDEKCPWATKFEPVPGWKAKKTKILRQGWKATAKKREYIDSFDVYECPLFELMYEIKAGIVANAGKVRKSTPKNNFADSLLEYVKKLWFDEGNTAKEISDKTGFDEKTIYRTVKKIKESENK